MGNMKVHRTQGVRCITPTVPQCKFKSYFGGSFYIRATDFAEKKNCSKFNLSSVCKVSLASSRVATCK